MKPNQLPDVERGMSFFLLPCAASRSIRLRWLPLLVIFACSAAMLRADDTPVSPAKPKLDVLMFKDGDRVTGHLVGRSGHVMVFDSDRFGLLRVPASEARVVLANPAPEAPAEPAVVTEPGSALASLSPLVLARDLRDMFGSWHGRFAFSAEQLSDSLDHSSTTVEGSLKRKWAEDEVQLNGRYSFSEADHTTSTDLVKADGLWRHDFVNRLFTTYRPTLEWNRANFSNGVPADYVLLQQEIGTGVNVWSSGRQKLRTGVSENLFDVWVTPTNAHSAQTSESAFVEAESKLPWQITLSDRGVWYYSLADERQGWENHFEIEKNLTETLSVGVRHEVRYNNPDARIADSERLRFMVGFDF